MSQTKTGEWTILEDDMLAEAICKVSIVDSVGGGMGKHISETMLYDRLFRLLRRHLLLGPAKLSFGEWRISSRLLLRCVMLNRKLVTQSAAYA